MSSVEMEFNDIPPKATELIQLIGSVAIDGDYVFSEEKIDEIITEMKLIEFKKQIFEKLIFLKVIKGGYGL
ncbi:MAG TPA: hypothetical protein VG895_01255 [Patescibacteria group bacterium]|nr:hypothetical protein [Patescibacteria group bacterium]